MKARDIETGAVYVARVSGRLCHVRILGSGPSRAIRGTYGRTDRWAPTWQALNLATGRVIRILSAQRLRERVSAPAEMTPAGGSEVTC